MAKKICAVYCYTQPKTHYRQLSMICVNIPESSSRTTLPLCMWKIKGGRYEARFDTSGKCEGTGRQKRTGVGCAKNTGGENRRGQRLFRLGRSARRDRSERTGTNSPSGGAHPKRSRSIGGYRHWWIVSRCTRCDRSAYAFLQKKRTGNPLRRKSVECRRNCCAVKPSSR